MTIELFQIRKQHHANLCQERQEKAAIDREKETIEKTSIPQFKSTKT